MQHTTPGVIVNIQELAGWIDTVPNKHLGE